MRSPVAALMLLAQAAVATPEQFVLINTSAESIPAAFEQIGGWSTNRSPGKVGIGVGAIFSYLQQPRDRVLSKLTRFLELSEKHNVPVVVQLDGENWWGNRPDLWNWWDPQKPGYAASNAVNVEWTGWSHTNAIKIAWRNWGRQIRVLPPPNLMSPRYRAACHEEMRALVPVVLNWWKALPETKRRLLVGIKLGWESSVGVNAWYYPNGNDLLAKPESEDPVIGLKAEEPPARGVVPLGYAALKTSGIRSQGDITEADLAEVVRRHLEDLCRVAASLGVPREKLFTHVAGWKENELLYQSGLNRYSCPGWSFYKYAEEPERDIGVRDALRRSDAPHWGAVEWLLQGTDETARWEKALTAMLRMPGCKYLCIYNWDGVEDKPGVITALRSVSGSGR